ncbi:hypothetical protein BD309DRAFT_957708 [Dichomitus squalens]|uniref:N-acetylglucosaminylphosphatidylinositol deacetylase n=1 Tax=Dichomitus squalens TaxID=114155 RepID=A0A4Q9NUW4_9APHY|nr:hypothetical protein BD311DRAFT_761355 [Dichomitus squalens]TBU44735.1 hypothetical protein BD309DRAFT_957708 [Dichomitus squalens]TBU56046.1 hypothetical protein BD310DRAFT_932236 [Dichomitus squalens]
MLSSMYSIGCCSGALSCMAVVSRTGQARHRFSLNPERPSNVLLLMSHPNDECTFFASTRIMPQESLPR